MRYVAHGCFAYVNEISFADPEHLVHGGVAGMRQYTLCIYQTLTNNILYLQLQIPGLLQAVDLVQVHPLKFLFQLKLQ